jgi:hypothetical protein
MGVVRSRFTAPLNQAFADRAVATFGMVAALLVRRKQFLLKELDDPFPAGSGASGFVTVRSAYLLPDRQTDDKLAVNQYRTASCSISRTGNTTTSLE